LDLKQVIYGEFDNELVRVNGRLGVNQIYGNVTQNIRSASGIDFVFRVEDKNGTLLFQIDSLGRSGFGQHFNNVALTVRGIAGDFRHFLVEDSLGANEFEVNSDGNVNVNNTLSKGAGTFKIDHPLDPENKYLYHSFVESPDMMNVYNGNVITDANAIAVIDLPDYFMALNKDYRYQLTVIGTFAQAIIKEEVSNNKFVIQTSEPNIKVSWQVTGIRQDAYANKNRIQVEVDKSPEEKGYFLHPEALGKAVSKRIGIEKRSEKGESGSDRKVR